MDALQEARNYLEQYQYRMNQDNFRGDLESRTRYENCAYQEGMLQAAIAEAELLKRIADALEMIAAGPAETMESHAAMRRLSDTNVWEDYDKRR